MTSFKKELLKYAFHSDPNEGLSKLYWETDVFKAVRSWLEQKRLQIQIEDGTPDVKQWYYACIDELLRELKDDP